MKTIQWQLQSGLQFGFFLFLKKNFLTKKTIAQNKTQKAKICCIITFYFKN